MAIYPNPRKRNDYLTEKYVFGAGPTIQTEYKPSPLYRRGQAYKNIPLTSVDSIRSRTREIGLSRQERDYFNPIDDIQKYYRNTGTMPINPQILNAPVLSYADGGSIGDPITGIGIQYQERLPDVPNLDAARYFMEQRQIEEQKLQAERDKLRPSRQAILTNIANLQGTEGQKKAMTDNILGQLDEYDKNLRKDPNWVFSSEGRDKFVNLINSSVDPVRIEQMKTNYANIQAGKDQLIKNNMLDAYQVNNGQILVRDNQTGATSEIPLSQLDPTKFTPLTGSEIINDVSQKTDYNPNTHKFYTSIDNTDKAIDNLLGAFQTASGSIAESNGYLSVQDNNIALQAAKKQALKDLSPSSLSALQEKYIKETGGKYNQGGFDQYINSILDNEIRKRRQRQASLALPKEEKTKDKDSRTTLDLTEGVPTYQQLNTTKTVKNTAGFDSNIDVHIQGSSVIPVGDTEPKPLTIDGPVWTFGGEHKESNYSSERNRNGFYGDRKKISKTFENAIHISDDVVPVTTGEVYDQSGSKQAENLDSGLMIIKTKDSESYDYGSGSILAGIPVTKLQIPYTGRDGQTNYREIDVMQRSDGKFVEVKMTGVGVYKTSDQYGWGNPTEQTLFVPKKPDESMRSFGVNMSPYNYNIEYITANGFPSDPQSEGMRLIQMIRSLNPTLFSTFVNEYNQALSGGKIDYATRVKMNETLNYLRKKIEEGTIRNTFSIAKPDFTKKDESDYIR